ncbi:MAG: hypothetical protein IT287_05900 [Bdellovibrionaceae bacterium]|nr:hypothetical protein [Pseudobdellovibrionaceae bacterium]
MNPQTLIIEIIGWISTATFLISIVLPQRLGLHQWGVFTSVTTGIYAYSHGATAIWVKWFIAFFFHLYMWYKIIKNKPEIQ